MNEWMCADALLAKKEKKKGVASKTTKTEPSHESDSLLVM